MSAPARAVLLVIGNELLNGEVQDCNFFTLARELTRQGFSVQQAAMVRDTSHAIAASLIALLETHPDVLISSGGLGPTEDDGTLLAVAEALESPLSETPAARDLVEAHYDRLLAAGHVPRRGPAEARRKMAQLPIGATPLPNPIGVAPGVWLEHGPTLLICLPGVPAELEAILHATVLPLLTARFGRRVWAERALTAHCADEADVAALLRAITSRYPDVYIKSLAHPFPAAGELATSNAELRIIAAMHAPDEVAAQRRLAEVMGELQAALARAGVPVLRTGLD